MHAASKLLKSFTHTKKKGNMPYFTKLKKELSLNPSVLWQKKPCKIEFASFFLRVTMCFCSLILFSQFDINNTVNIEWDAVLLQQLNS